MDIKNGALIFIGKHKKILHMSILFESNDAMMVYCIPKYSHSYICNAYEYINKMKCNYDITYRNPLLYTPKTLKTLCHHLVGSLPENIYHFDKYMFEALFSTDAQKAIVDNYDAIQIGYIFNKLNICNNKYYHELTIEDFHDIGFDTMLYGIYSEVKRLNNNFWKMDCVIRAVDRKYPKDVYNYIYSKNDETWITKINSFLSLLDKSEAYHKLKSNTMKI